MFLKLNPCASGMTRRARCLLAAVAAVGVSLAVSTAQAQQPASPPAKAAPQKTQKPAAPTTASDSEKEQGSQAAWVKICEPNAGADKKKVCLVHHERIDGNTGMVLVSAAIRQIEGQDKEQFMIMVPLGMALPPGAFARVDEGKPIELKYTLCHAAGCTAEAEASPELVESLKKGKQLMVAAVNLAGKPVGFPVPLNGFTKAYTGEPIDNEKYREARKALLMQIRQRQMELAKKAADAAKTNGGQQQQGQAR